MNNTTDNKPAGKTATDILNEQAAEIAQLKERNQKVSADLMALDAELTETKRNYDGACKTIAEMHAAAVGGVKGPNRGVVEDVADVRQRLDNMDKLHARIVEKCETADPDELTVRAHDMHRINFLIHHATSITIGETTISGDVLLQLRKTLDGLRGTMKDAKPQRTLRTEA